ncbi:reverse transcriptase domain-containing protein [Tanacetum coccineum]
MSATRQGMSYAKIDQIVAQGVTDATKAIVVYETKMPSNKKAYARNLPYCNKYKLHYDGPCIVRCGKCKRVGHMNKNCKASVATMNQRASVATQKSAVICYECGRHGHYKRECLKLKNQNYGNQKGNEGKTRENSKVVKDYADC